MRKLPMRKLPMRKMTKLTAALMIGTFAIAPLSLTPLAMATGAQRTSKFTSTLKPLRTPIRIEVKLSDDLAYRAEHLSKNIRDRSRAFSLNSGFSGNGYFGQKDLDRLTRRLKKRMTARLAKKGFEVSDQASAVLEITLVDAKPNRPTFSQMSKQPGLSMDSFGLGGARFEAILKTPSGALGQASYGYFEQDIRDAHYGGTWTDADRAIDRFVRKTAKALAGQ